jgi:hypothetical protein
VVIVIHNSDKQVGLYSGGLYSGGGAYVWNEVSVSTCGGLIHRGVIFGGGLYSEVYGIQFGVQICSINEYMLMQLYIENGIQM